MADNIKTMNNIPKTLRHVFRLECHSNWYSNTGSYRSIY